MAPGESVVASRYVTDYLVPEISRAIWLGARRRRQVILCGPLG